MERWLFLGVDWVGRFSVGTDGQHRDSENEDTQKGGASDSVFVRSTHLNILPLSIRRAEKQAGQLAYKFSPRNRPW